MLDIQGRKYAAVTVCDVTLYDINTNYPVMFFDTLQLTSIDSAVETTDIQGGQGNATLASISHTKNIDVQFDDAIMTMSSLALLTGGELSFTDDEAVTKTAVKITMPETEIVTVADGKVKLSKTAKAGSHVWGAKMINGILSTATRLTEPEGLDTTTDEIDLTELYNVNIDGDESKPGYADGDTLRVFYEHEITTTSGDGIGSELKVLADKFAGSYRFIGDTVLFNQYSGENDLFQIEIPNLKLDSSYSMSFQASTEAIVFSFKGKALRNDKKEMIIFRQVQSGGSDQDNGELGEAVDGLYKTLPAKRVIIETDKEIKDISI